MLKGVHHRIVEIRQTDSPYFERALLFVRADLTDENEQSLMCAGKRFVRGAGSYEALRQGRAMRWFKRTALVLLGGFLGVLAGVLLSATA